MYPTDAEEELRARVAQHIGAAELLPDGRMRCPNCDGQDFGPTLSPRSLSFYREGYLPGAPLLMGVCLDCQHATEPQSTPAGIDQP